MTNEEKIIGYMKNNWRRRDVTIYETNDPTRVRAVGVSFDSDTVVDVIEDREHYKRAISMFPRVYIYD